MPQPGLKTQGSETETRLLGYENEISKNVAETPNFDM